MSTRIFFDGGSQKYFITEELAQKLGRRYLGSERLTIGVFGSDEEERDFRRVIDGNAQR